MSSNISYRPTVKPAEFAQAKERIGNPSLWDSQRSAAAHTLGAVAAATDTFDAAQKKEALDLLVDWANRGGAQDPIYVMTAAARALALIRTPEADAETLKLLDATKTWSVPQQVAVMALVDRNDAKACEMIEHVAMTHPYGMLRAHAIRAFLELYPKKEAGAALVRIAKAPVRSSDTVADVNAEDRKQALAALSTWNSPPFDVLLGDRSGLGDPNPSVRVRTAQLLAPHRDEPRVKSALEALLRSPVSELAKAAKAALTPPPPEP